MKQVEINGVLWDTENLKVGDQEHFTYDEAIKIAKSRGKRLPTIYELEQLIKGTAWDPERKGQTAKGLFFPANGFRDNSDSIVFCGSYGSYWSSTVYGSTSQHAWCLLFCSDYAGFNVDNLTYGFSVRLVQDKKLMQDEINSDKKYVRTVTICTIIISFLIGLIIGEAL